MTNLPYDKPQVAELNRRIGERVRDIRLKRRIRQNELARRVGVKSPQIHKFETGDQRISSGMLKAIADALQTPTNAFYDDENVSL